MYTKLDLFMEYKRDTGLDAYIDGRMTTRYSQWLEDKLFEIKRKEKEDE